MCAEDADVIFAARTKGEMPAAYKKRAGAKAVNTAERSAGGGTLIENDSTTVRAISPRGICLSREKERTRLPPSKECADIYQDQRTTL